MSYVMALKMQIGTFILFMIFMCILDHQTVKDAVSLFHSRVLILKFVLELAAHVSISLGWQDGFRIQWSRLEEVGRQGSGAFVSSRYRYKMRGFSMQVKIEA